MKPSFVLRRIGTRATGGVRIEDQHLLEMADAKPSREASDRIERLEAASAKAEMNPSSILLR